MELTFSIGLVGLAVLAVGALAIGATDLFLSQEATGIEATATAIGAFIGGFVASEFAVTWRDWEPVFDGLALGPALIGGLLVGVITAVVVRLVTNGFDQTAES